MSAIAQVLHDRGEAVSGSDRQDSDTVRRLQAEGIRVSIGHSTENVNGADVVVYSAAIPEDNPEMVEARRRGLPLLERPQMLGKLMEPYKHRVAVSGTHGKTTTTSMISAILDRARVDATSLIGGDLAVLGGNARLGAGSVIVVEACEAFGSFLHLGSSIAVITNIDADHLDYYGTIENVEQSFRQFIERVDSDGTVIACWDDARVRRVVEGCGRTVISFGLSDSPDVLAADVDVSTPRPCYTLVRGGQSLGRIELGVPGEQNVVDSLAAAAVALELGARVDDIQDALADFRGAARRFDILYNDRGMMVVDDYAHHPAEIAATLNAAGSYGRRIIAVFQPHLYSRTRAFASEFAEALAIADEVIVTAIYAAREKPMEGVSGESIVEAMHRGGFTAARYAPDKDALPDELTREMREGDMALILGAGDIRQVAEKLAGMMSDGGGQ